MHCNPLSRMSRQLEVGICCFGLLESTPPLWCGLVELTTFPTSCSRSSCVTQNPGGQPSSLWPQQWFTHVHLSHSRPRKVSPAILFQPFRRKNLSSMSWTCIECWPSFWGSLWGTRLKLTWRKAERRGTKSRNCMSLQSRHALGFSDLKTKNSPAFSLSQFVLVFCHLQPKNMSLHKRS